MAEGSPSRFRQGLHRLRNSGKTKDFLVFLVFVAIAAVFWFIMALNDDVQTTYDVELKIDNVPDTVTFITEPPAKLHVTVRDRGLILLRNRTSQLHLSFQEYSEGNRFSISHAALAASLRHVFGGAATISSVSPDSVSFVFTGYPGHRVPLHLDYDVTAAPGMILGTPRLSTSSVTVYSTSKADTVRRMLTEKVMLRNIEKNVTVDVPVVSAPGLRVEPSTVRVTFTVEPLVRKESEIPVTAENVPVGQDMLFFPSKVKVVYYVPMSHYSETNVPIVIGATYGEAEASSTDKVAVRLVSKATYMSNVELMQDSVEYTLVKNK